MTSELPYRIDHVGIAVSDLDAALTFWQDVMGFVVTHRESNAEQQVEEAMLLPGPSAVQSTPPGGTDAATPLPPPAVQLLAPTTNNSAIAKFIDSRGPGLQQIAVAVNDIEAATRRIAAMGIRVLYDAPKQGTAGSLINFLHPSDTGGVLIELVQPAPVPQS